MSYIKESLSKNEVIQVQASLHWIVWFWFTLWCLLAIPTLGLTIIFAIVEYVKIKSIDMGATNKRIISKSGVFSLHTQEIKISSVETISISQSILGRMLGFGSVTITGRGISNIVFNKIKDPLVIKRTIESVDVDYEGQKIER